MIEYDFFFVMGEPTLNKGSYSEDNTQKKAVSLGSGEVLQMVCVVVANMLQLLNS